MRLRSRANHNILEPAIYQGVLGIQHGNLWMRREGQTSIFEIADNANDCHVHVVRYILFSSDLQRWRRPDVNLPADGIFCREKAPVEFLANQCHRRARGGVRLREISSANQRNSQSSKEMLIHNSKLRCRYILNACDSLPRNNQHLSPSVIPGQTVTRIQDEPAAQFGVVD